jgi:HAD superfamily hydrolase (TIGR01458 family)
MDGVLYTADNIISGAVEAAAWLRTQGIPYLFVTNTTSKSRAALVDKLLSFGIPVQETEILTPAAVAAEWLRAREEGGIALFVPPSARLEFTGLACLPDDAERGASYVVVGDLAKLWDYRTLNRAFRLLYHNPDAQLIALGMTRYWLAPDGIALDVAPFVVALEHASGRKAMVFGKPAKPFFQAAVEKLRLPAAQVVMIGDDIEADVGGAQTAGLKGALVQTGKFRPADLEGSIKPDIVFASVADLLSWWDGQAM